MRLETERLILRKPKISDWKDVIGGAGDLEVSKQTENIPYPYSKEDAIGWIKESIDKWNKKESYVFFIELKSEKKVIGCIALSKVSKFRGTCMTGSWINKKYWRKGFITEAKIAANNFAFSTLKLRKLNSIVHTDNIASNKTQKSMGYKLEGLKKKDTRTLSTGKIKDVNLYGLFKENWKKNLPKLKSKLKQKINENKMKSDYAYASRDTEK